MIKMIKIKGDKTFYKHAVGLYSKGGEIRLCAGQLWAMADTERTQAVLLGLDHTSNEWRVIDIWTGAKVMRFANIHDFIDQMPGTAWYVHRDCRHDETYVDYILASALEPYFVSLHLSVGNYTAERHCASPEVASYLSEASLDDASIKLYREVYVNGK